MDSYLELASTVLKEMRRPLDARQILRAAYQLSIVPMGLYGRTQHKTLHARLAEDIRKHRARSEFVRTDPGRFFLRCLLSDPTIPRRYKREYPAQPRADQLRHFDVLCFPRAAARFIEGGALLDCSLLETIPIVPRRLADIFGDETFVFLRTFVITQRSRSIVARRTGVNVRDAIVRRTSLGSLGFVKDIDKTMFSTDPWGILDASLRTLIEQLDLNQQESDFIHSQRLLSLLGLIPAPIDARENSVIAVAVCRCPETFDPISRFIDSGTLYWTPLESKINDLASLDPWSRELENRGIFGMVASC